MLLSLVQQQMQLQRTSLGAGGLLVTVEGFCLFVCVCFWFLSPSNISVLIVLLSQSPTVALQSVIRENVGVLLLTGIEERIISFME